MGAVGGQSRERLPLHNEEGTKERKPWGYRNPTESHQGTSSAWEEACSLPAGSLHSQICLTEILRVSYLMGVRLTLRPPLVGIFFLFSISEPCWLPSLSGAVQQARGTERQGHSMGNHRSSSGGWILVTGPGEPEEAQEVGPWPHVLGSHRRVCMFQWLKPMPHSLCFLGQECLWFSSALHGLVICPR